MTQWEYDEAFVAGSAAWGHVLDELGEDGWELVAVVAEAAGMYRLVLKRPLEEPDDA